jgi:hypothetical protein
MNEDVCGDINKDEIAVEPGACFGWYSPVATDCNQSHCLRSEWCRQYTVNNATKEEEKTMKLDLEDLGQESKIKSETKEEKKAKVKVMAELGKQAFFDHAVNAAASLVKHDSIKYNPKRSTASLKVGGKVIAFLSRKRDGIDFELGGRNQGCPVMKINFGSDGAHIKDLIKPFVESNGVR